MTLSSVCLGTTNTSLSPMRKKRFRDIIKEKDLEIDARFSALEKVIELQNRATIMAVESVMQNALENVKDVIHEKQIEGMSTPIFEEAEFYKGTISHEVGDLR